MHQLLLGEKSEIRATDETTVNRLLTGSTNRLVCPNLLHLTCYITTVANLRLIPYFLSPHLTRLTFHDRLSGGYSMGDFFPGLRSTFQAIPTRCLQELTINIPAPSMRHLSGEVSSVIQRCGSSLRVLDVPVPLGDAAVRHLSRLKNLKVWSSIWSPPPAGTPSTSTAFPSLSALVFSRKTAYGWIPWLTQRGRGSSDAQDGYLEHAKSNIAHLVFWEPVLIDATFVSPFRHFPNLVTLEVESGCRVMPGCSFSLTDQNVMELSNSLPLLEELHLGTQCSRNASHVTVASFLALSARCKDLRSLWIHFNARNLAEDFRLLSEDPALRELRLLPTRCPLDFFDAGESSFPSGVSDDDVTTIAKGFLDIFPSLISIFSADSGWNPLDSRICELQRTQAAPLVQTEA